MSDRKLENQVLWFVCGSLLLIVLNMILIQINHIINFEIFEIIKDPSFSGSLAGALLTGLIAITIFLWGEKSRKDQIEREKACRNKLSIKKFIMVNNDIIMFIDYFIDEFDGELFNEVKRYKYEMYIQDINSIYEILNMIEPSHFEEQMALNYLIFQRKLVYLRNEIGSLVTLPELQQIHNIQNLSDILKGHKKDFVSLEQLLKEQIV